MRIEVFGPGCAKCNKLYDNACKAVADAGADAEVVKVSEHEDIAAAGVMLTPALAIDGQVKASGRVSSSAQIAHWIEEAGG